MQPELRNASWLVFDKVIRIAFHLVVGIYIAKMLGPEQFGRLNYIIAYVAIFSPIANLGLDAIIVRELVASPERKYQKLGAAAVLRLAGAGIAILVCNGAQSIIAQSDQEISELIFILSLALCLQSIEIIDLWFQSKVASKYTVWAKLPSLLLCTAGRIFLIKTESSISSFVIIQVIEGLIAALGLVAIYVGLGEAIQKWEPSMNHCGTLMSEAWPLLLAGISVVLYMKVDMLMLEQLSNDRQVGLYSAATKISEGFYFVPMIIVSTMAPKIIKSKQTDCIVYNETFFRLYILLARLGLFVSVAVTLAATSLIPLLYGNQYAESARILQVHIWATLAVFFGVASSQYLIIEGYQTIAFYRTTIGLAVNIALNLWLIPVYGAMGAALATVISYVIATCAIVVTNGGRQQLRLMMLSLIRAPWPNRLSEN